MDSQDSQRQMQEVSYSPSDSEQYRRLTTAFLHNLASSISTPPNSASRFESWREMSIPPSVSVISTPPLQATPPADAPALAPQCLASKVEQTFVGYFHVGLMLTGCYDRFRRLPFFLRYILAMFAFVPCMSFIGTVAVEVIFQVTNSSLIASNVVACVGGAFGHMLCAKHWKRIIVWALIMAAVFLSVPPPSVDELAKLPQTVRHLAYEEECVKRNITSSHAPFRLSQIVRCNGVRSETCEKVMKFAEQESEAFVQIKAELIRTRSDLYSESHKLTLSHRNHSIGKMGIDRSMFRSSVSYPFVDQIPSSRVSQEIVDVDRMFMMDIDITDKATRKSAQDLKYMIWVNGYTRLINRVGSVSQVASLYLGFTTVPSNTWFLQAVSVGSDFASWVFPYAASFFGPPTKVLEVHREICDLLPCSEEKPKVQAPKTVDDQIPTPTGGDNQATKTETKEQEAPADEKNVVPITQYGRSAAPPPANHFNELVIPSFLAAYLTRYRRANIHVASWLR